MAAKRLKNDEIAPQSKRGGRRPGAGRKTNPVKVIRESLLDAANARIGEWMPSLLGNLKVLADRGDRQANEYLINRLLGRPAEKVEHSGPDGGPVPLAFAVALVKVYGDPDGPAGGGA